MWLLNVSVLQDIVHGHTWLELECGGPARWVEQRTGTCQSGFAEKSQMRSRSLDEPQRLNHRKHD